MPNIKKYKLIACSVLKKEIDSLHRSIPEDVELTEVWLEQGLHREPERLNSLLKAEIKATESKKEPYDALILGYGICSRGTVGIKSSRYRIVVPRAHDCITLFLGSKERYLDEFSRAPGTYWFTPGFVSGAIQPGMSEKYSGVYREFEENYEKYLKRFGDKDLAKYIIEQQEQAWIKNYSRGAYVESGLPGGETLRKKAGAFCEARDWVFEEVKGDLGLLRELLSGEWDSGRFLILEPGESLEIGGIDEIITTRGTDYSAYIGENYKKSYVYDGEYKEIAPGTPVKRKNNVDLVIGIDAGGTYTDAVIVSLLNNKVLASSKSPTTHYDLSVGIKNSLLQLPDEMLKKACRLAISTTLATNAIVEEKGALTGLILIGYETDTTAMVTVGFGDIKETVAGCHDIYGNETEPLDEAGLVRTADTMLARGVEAFAVSSYMATRNPDHEIRAHAILSEKYSVPVAVGHELTGDIDSVRRAHTVLLNARLLPVIDMLIHSVNRVVRELKLPAEVRLVTTDGALMNTAEAHEKPVRLVLSGPAASVKGVRFLADIESCVLFDIGGTTSDIAVIEGGSAKRTSRGAFVGKYKTSIKATDIRTLGLGGDSGIKWEHGRVKVGPERVIPICVLAADHPHIVHDLKELPGYNASDYGLVQPGTFYVVVRQPENDSFLTGRERTIMSLLAQSPLSVVELAERLVYPYLSLLGTERLEKLGFIRKSGLTPTDLLVAYKLIEKWDKQAAEQMIELYSERSGLLIPEFVRIVWSEVHRLAASAVITEVLAGGNGDASFPGCRFCADSLDNNTAVEVTYRLKNPLVGIGASSHLLLDGLDRFLAAEKVFPEHAAVANAVGAASGAGGIHIDLTVLPDNRGRFVLYSPEGMRIFSSLESAKEEALSLTMECALTYAQRMNYENFSLDVHIRDRSAPTAFESELYIDTSIVGVMRY